MEEACFVISYPDPYFHSCDVTALSRIGDVVIRCSENMGLDTRQGVGWSMRKNWFAKQQN